MTLELVKPLDIKCRPNVPVTELLEQWGMWSCSGIGTGSLSTPTYENTHWITDDIGLWVERAVGQLGVSDEHRKACGVKAVSRKHAVMLYYRNRYNLPMLAQSLKVGETKAKTILIMAECWVEGYLGLHELAAG